MNHLYIGSVSSPLLAFDDETIMTISGEMAVSAIGEEFSADALECEVIYDDDSRTLRDLPYATKLYYWQDESQVAMYYFQHVKRVGSNRYVIYGTSFVGLLENETSYGGMWFGETLQNVFYKIIAQNGVEDVPNFSKYKMYRPFRMNRVGTTVYHAELQPNGGYDDITMQHSLHAEIKGISMTINTSSSSYEYLLGGSASSGSMYYYRLRRSISTGTTYIQYNNSAYSIAPSSSDSIFANGDTVIIDAVPSHGYIDITFQKADGREFYRQINISSTTATGNIPLCTIGGYVSRSSSGTFTRYNADSSIEFRSFQVRTPYEYVPGEPDPVTGEIPFIEVGNELVCDAVCLGGTSAYDLCSNTMYSSASMDANEEDMIGVALLDGSGNMIVPQGTVDYEIITAIDIDYTIANIPVYGWIGVCSKREAIYQLLFASCMNLVKTDYGFQVTRLSNTDITSIADGSIYIDGNVEEYQAVNLIELTEHTYDSYQASQEIFDNTNETSRTGEYIITFNSAPIAGTPVAGSGITIVSYNCNAAVVTGKGKITGTPYYHGTKVIRGEIGDYITGKTVSVTDATLVTFMTSENVMNRLSEFYKAAYKVNAGVYYNNTAVGDSMERCGKRYSLTDAFGETQIGFLEHMSLTVSKITKAVCTFLCGYLVPENTFPYTRFVVLAGSGSWPVPSGVTKVKAVLIGGGDGGYSGYPGENGDNPGTQQRSTTVAHGGSYGESGTPGKILIVDINNPSSTIAYSTGAGGSGGAPSEPVTSGQRTSNPGSAGGATTFGSYSSANGSANDYGYINVLSGDRYAYKNEQWDETSGSGGDGGYIECNSMDFIGLVHHQAASAYNKLTSTNYPGGSDGSDFDPWGVGYFATGGSGGGGAIGDTGAKNGTAPHTTGSQEPLTLYAGVGHSGGDGWFYTPPTPTVYGVSGLGGVGGGGGGSVGILSTDVTDSSSYYYSMYHGTATSDIPLGGAGGAGGSGAGGCIIVYY